jgi:hypothetical protein
VKEATVRFARLLRHTGSALTAAALLAAAPPAHGATRYVADNGVNGATCGSQANPCRSISLAIGLAAPGDTIIVGPGRYGDLDGDGLLGETGEEIGVADCPPLQLCPIRSVIRVNKAVTILSSHGAASTVIDARSVNVAQNVLLNGGEFGRPGKGFTVTNTKQHLGDGIVIDGADVKVRGNQVLSTSVYPFTQQQPAPQNGISALSPGSVLIEGNQVIGQWSPGIIAAGAGKRVRRNQVSVSTGYGIYGIGDAVVFGNIVTSTGVGILLQNAASAIGNSVHGAVYGIGVNHSESSPFTGAIERNNIADSLYCGLSNEQGVPGLNATNNYWGAASGPGPDPADDVCNDDGGTTTVTPFATKPFPVSAPIKP